MRRASAPPEGSSGAPQPEAQGAAEGVPWTSLLQGLPDGYLVIRQSGTIAWANRAAATLLGLASADRILGRDAATVLSPDDPEAARDTFQAARQSREAVSLETRWERPDGSAVDVMIHITGGYNAPGMGHEFLAVVHDRTSEARSLDAVRASRQMLRLILDTIPVRVFWKDRDSRYLGCNRLYARDGGLDDPEAIIGLTDYDLGFRNHAARYRADDREVMESGVPKLGYEEPQTSPDGRPLWLRTSKVPLRDAHGQIIGVLGTYEDITAVREASLELARRNRELREANRELERLHRSKDEFLAMVSHELRTPLVTGIGYVELLLQGRFGSMSDVQAERLRIAHRNLLRLSTIIQNLLSYQSVIRPGSEASLGLTSFGLGPLLEQCAEESRVRNRDLGPRLRVAIAPDLPDVRADSELLRIVVANLLDNAARHAGPDAHITLAVEPTEAGARVTVQDDGRGMEPEVMARAFEPFVKTAAEHGGSGLGLAIVHGILDAHGFGLTLESERGKGTAFRFVVPWATSHAAGQEEPPVHRRERSITPVLGLPATARILLVAPTASVRTPVRLALLRSGYSVVEAESWEEAEQRVSFETVDLCVLELAPTDVEAQQQTAWLARRAGASGFPALLLYPATGLPNNLVQGFPNPVAHLCQPLTAKSITEAVHRLLQPDGSPGHPNDPSVL